MRNELRVAFAKERKASEACVCSHNWAASSWMTAAAKSELDSEQFGQLPDGEKAVEANDSHTCVLEQPDRGR